MNCKQAQVEIALMVGDDLDAAEQAALRLHLAACPDCAEYRERMLVGYEFLRTPAEELVGCPSESIWPSVAEHLTARTVSSRALRFSGWVPAAAVVAACLLIAVVSSYEMRPQPMPILTQPISSEPDRSAESPSLWNPWIETKPRAELLPERAADADQDSVADKPVHARLPEHERRNEF